MISEEEFERVKQLQAYLDLKLLEKIFNDESMAKHFWEKYTKSNKNLLDFWSQLSSVYKKKLLDFINSDEEIKLMN